MENHMNRFGLLVLTSVALAACGRGNPAEPAMDAGVIAAPAFAKASQPVYTCATPDAMVRSLMTLVSNATHVRAPATEALLLEPLRAAHTALVATPCDKDGALAAMASFNAAVDASASSLTATQVIAFHSLANRIIAAIKLVS
jgi:hypothetical protein